MKKVTIFLAFLFITVIGYASDDSSEIYVTKNNFIADRADFKSPFFVKEKYSLGWSGFSFQARGLLRLKMSKNEYKDFPLGSIFGFKTNGIKYIYNDSLKNYLAVLTESTRMNFFVGEKEKMVYRGVIVDNIFFYTSEIGDSIRMFNKENINKGFRNLKTQSLLLELESELNKRGLYMSMHKRQFIKAKKLVEDYLAKIQSE